MIYKFEKRVFKDRLNLSNSYERNRECVTADLPYGFFLRIVLTF